MHPSSGPAHSASPAALTILRDLSDIAQVRDIAAAPLPQRVLWRCGAVTLDAAAQAELKELAVALPGAEWENLVSLARANGMAPLVFEHVARSGLLGVLPTNAADAFRREYCTTLIANRRLQTTLRTLLDALGAAGIPVMPLKGFSLLQRFYGSLALRPMSDIDLLVARRDIGEAIRVLRALGFRSENGLGAPTGFYSWASAVVVYGGSPGPTIETHWELFGRGSYRDALPAALAWQRAATVELFGHQVSRLDPRDELRYLCVHAAAEHRLKRVIWLVDIAEIVRHLPPDWAWSSFVAETIAGHFALPVAVALAYCNAALQVSLPDGVLDDLIGAARSGVERVLWQEAGADLLSEDWVRAASRGITTPLEWAIFARGVLFPRMPTLEQLYGHMQAVGTARVSTQAQHAARTLPLLVRAWRSEHQAERQAEHQAAHQADG